MTATPLYPPSTSASAMPIPDLDSLLVLEAPFARAPYEDLRRRLRSHQRITDRDFSTMNSIVKELESSVADADKQALLEKIDSLIEKAKGVKDKLTPLTSDFQAALTSVQQRTHHLAQAHDVRARAAAAVPGAMDDPSSEEELHMDKALSVHAYMEFTDTRLQRMIVDWLSRMGFVSSAERVVESKRLQAFTDVSLFKELFAIRDSMVPPPLSAAKPSCSLALAWCLDNKAALRRIKSPLEFDLRLQEFIDLCRNRSPEGLFTARTYLRRHLLPLFKAATTARKDHSMMVAGSTPNPGTAKDDESEHDVRYNEKIVTEVTRALGLLAVPPSGWVYQDLYSTTRLPRLFSQLFAAAMSIYSLPPQPILNIALSAGLSSLKVPACYGGERKAAGESSAPEPAAVVDARNALTLSSAPAIPGVGEVDEDLMRDVRREVRAEHDKHRQQQVSSIGEHLHDGEADGTSSRMSETRNLDCPVCATIRLKDPSQPSHSGILTDGLGLGILAKEIPWSHHSNSTIVCRISGRVIDEGAEDGEGGQAVALPNGRVYSKRALESYSASLDGLSATSRKRRMDGKSSNQAFVTCPRTKDRFFTGQMRRVYIS